MCYQVPQLFLNMIVIIFIIVTVVIIIIKKVNKLQHTLRTNYRVTDYLHMKHTQ